MFSSIATLVVGGYLFASRLGHDDPLRMAVYMLALSLLAASATISAALPRRSVLLLAEQALSVALYIVLVMAIISSVGVYFVVEAFALLAALVLTARSRSAVRIPHAT